MSDGPRSCGRFAPVQQDAVPSSNLSFSHVLVFQKVKLWIKDVQGSTEVGDLLDVVHVRRSSKPKSGCKLPAWFNTVLVKTSPDEELCRGDGIQG